MYSSLSQKSLNILISQISYLLQICRWEFLLSKIDITCQIKYILNFILVKPVSFLKPQLVPFCDKHLGVYYILILIFAQNTRIFNWYFINYNTNFFFLLALALIFYVPFQIFIVYVLCLWIKHSLNYLCQYIWCKKKSTS